MGVKLTLVPSTSSPVLDEGGKFVEAWSGWFRNLYNLLKPGISTTVTLAKLTGGGANGSLTVVNGIITAYTAPT